MPDARRNRSTAGSAGRRASLRLALSTLAVMGFGLAEASAQSSIPVREPPPVEKHEPIPPEPLAASDSGHAWQAGHWRWLGNGWVWSPGRWAERPYPGARWVPGAWLERSYGWVWQPGQWYDVQAAASDAVPSLAPPVTDEVAPSLAPLPRR